MKKYTLKGSTEPTAFITKGKQRVKQYNNDTVYLHNGEEFELELFNPTSDKVMAKIKLNGNSIGSGIVLRPGERVFIERYLDEARKFMFQTYEVNGKSEDVKRAIANNGDVEVTFYKEEIPWNYPNITWTTPWPTWGTYTYTGGPSTTTFGGSSLTSHNVMYSNSLGDNEVKSFACMDSLGTLDFEPASASVTGTIRSKQPKSRKLSKSVETGRVDKGSHSNQSFNYDYSSFNSYWTWKTEWKILPVSQKPVVSEDIKVFCTNCGTRRKKSSHKFCPNCGTRF
jgi:hypothetical protein